MQTQMCEFCSKGTGGCCQTVVYCAHDVAPDCSFKHLLAFTVFLCAPVCLAQEEYNMKYEGD